MKTHHHPFTQRRHLGAVALLAALLLGLLLAGSAAAAPPREATGYEPADEQPLPDPQTAPTPTSTPSDTGTVSGSLQGEDECVDNPVSPDAGPMCGDEILVTPPEPEPSYEAFEYSEDIAIDAPATGLSVGAGSDANKKMDIMLDRLEEKLEDRKQACKDYKTQDLSKFDPHVSGVVDLTSGLTLAEAEAQMNSFVNTIALAMDLQKSGAATQETVDALWEGYRTAMETFARIYKVEHGVWPTTICDLLTK